MKKQWVLTLILLALFLNVVASSGASRFQIMDQVCHTYIDQQSCEGHSEVIVNTEYFCVWTGSSPVGKQCSISPDAAQAVRQNQEQQNLNNQFAFAAMLLFIFIVPAIILAASYFIRKNSIEKASIKKFLPALILTEILFVAALFGTMWLLTHLIDWTLFSTGIAILANCLVIIAVAFFFFKIY
ncbi:MAG: hypothetical protein V1777_01900 [Candidatus Micrarchaeota archaeon]